jgi:hypothetical protein
MVIKQLFIFFCILALFLYSCDTSSESKNEENNNLINQEDYYEFKGVSLKEYAIPASIMLPDETANIGASTVVEVLHKEGDFLWDILVGPNFSLHIEDYGDRINMVENKRQELEGETLFRVEYLLNQKDLMIYKKTLIVKGSIKASPNVGVEHKSFHVYGQKISKGITYELRSQDSGSSLEIIRLMAKSIKSFKTVE